MVTELLDRAPVEISRAPGLNQERSNMKHSSAVRRLFVAAAVSAVLALSGCGGGSSATTGDVTIRHLPSSTALASAPAKPLSAPASLLPATIDAMHVEFFDNAGRSVFGPVEVASSPLVTIRDVPLSASSTTVHYLRNGGFALARDDEPVAWDGAVGSASPTPTTVAASSSFTRWKTSVDSNGVARISLSSSQISGGAPKDFLLKGVAYSPAPIGTSNENAPGFGDLFWDTPRPGGFLDFDRVWKRDIENIRARGFNSVRVYSLIANFTWDNGGTPPTPAQIADESQLRYREHKKFLDEAWNNGLNPVYVLAGIPMPDHIFIKGVFDGPSAANAAQKVFWDNNFTATVEQLKDHPAIIGFTMFNELGGENDFQGTSPSSTHYWSQVQEYSKRAKSIAPDKLIGWAFFDNVPFANNTIELRRTYAKAVDFYGVNAFQPETIASLDPWKKATQGDTARPIFLTEFGIPATGRNNANPGAIYADDSTIQKAADAMAKMLPLVFQHPAVAGMFYFEWSDEWWKQNPSPESIKRHDGGVAAANFPNRWYDEEGFGLHSIALGDRTVDQLYADALWGKGSNVQFDILTPRTSLMDAVMKAYANAEQGRKTALGIN
ncbi:MAG: hypothetical protein V4684_19035 [Pseudomonadota bacterium]